MDGRHCSPPGRRGPCLCPTTGHWNFDLPHPLGSPTPPGTPGPSGRMSLYGTVRNLLRSLSLSVPLTLIFFDNVAYVAKVEGVSMQPTFNDDTLPDTLPETTLGRYLHGIKSNDLVFLSHWSTRNYRVQRGDVVSLVSPKDPNQIIIKRIIALEGDTVITRGKRNFENITIPRGHCWVEGDNPLKSFDSNTFGPVAVGLITARAQAVVWPPRRWQKLEAKMPDDRIESLISFSPFNGSYTSGAQVLVDLKDCPRRFDVRTYEEESSIE